MNEIKLRLPLSPDDIQKLQIGDKVLLSGTMYTARDQAHKRFIKALRNNDDLPINFSQTALFYCGPSPAAPGKICGAIGPTTSSRMDPYSRDILEAGLRVMIGKGDRSEECEALIREYGGVYFIAIGGVSAVLSRCIVSCETFLWQDLGAEAVHRMVVRDLPLYVGIV